MWKSSAITLTLSGGTANGFTGVTTVNSGVSQLGQTAGVNAIGGALVIGDGRGSSNTDVVRLLANDQIADSARLRMSRYAESQDLSLPVRGSAWRPHRRCGPGDRPTPRPSSCG